MRKVWSLCYLPFQNYPKLSFLWCHKGLWWHSSVCGGSNKHITLFFFVLVLNSLTVARLLNLIRNNCHQSLPTRSNVRIVWQTYSEQLFSNVAGEPWSPFSFLAHLWISLLSSVVQDKNTTVTGGDLSPVIMIFCDISHPCQFSINYQQSKTCWLIKTNCLGSEGQGNLFIIW